jgi:hypothetical protein
MQHAIDPETHHPVIPARFEVDVAGALVERILHQPVDDGDHMLVVGVEVLAAAPQLDQLFEVDFECVIFGRRQAGLIRNGLGRVRGRSCPVGEKPECCRKSREEPSTCG